MRPQEFTDRAAVWLATGLGIGLVSPAPGTIGGLWGLPLAWILSQLDSPTQQIVIILLVLASVAVCTIAARALGGSKDPQAIVLDEIVALPIVFLGVTERTPVVWLAGFLLFRFFDITKLWPTRQAERLPSGWGIVADDCVAALYGCLALQALVWLDQKLELGWLALTA